MAGELWKIGDLMSRWDLTERQVRDLVKPSGVPMVEMGIKGRQVNWRTARFRPESILRWEESRERERMGDEPAAKPRPAVAQGWGEVPNRLGKW